jgi:hypothetical protein
MSDASTGTITKFDVISFAKDILNEVDGVRAFSDAVDEDTKEGFALPAESRINAFFRLIGLPMFVTVKEKDNAGVTGELTEGDIHVTPGYSRSFSRTLSDYSIDNSADVKKDLVNREVTLLKGETNVGTKETNSAMTNAMTYLLPLTANVPDSNKKISSQIGEGGITRTVFKKLKPLMTACISGGIRPIRNELARPFLRDAKEQLVDSETTLPKPFIETVIRTRLVSCAGGGSAQQQQNQNDFLTSLKEYVGEEQFSEIYETSPELFSSSDLLESFVVSRLVNSLSQLAGQWVEIQKIQQRINQQTKFQIVIKTTSSKQSPFGKRTSITADTLAPENSDIGKRLSDLRKKQVKQEALLSLLPTENVVTNDENQKIKNTKNVALAALVTPFSTLVSSSLVQIKKQISDIENDLVKKGQEIERLRLQIEMMTGEFTGLSVPDVVVVITALFMLDKKDLIMLLDTDSIIEMEKDPVLNSALSSLGIGTPDTADALAAVNNLEKLVDQLYAFLNNEVSKLKNRPTRNRKITKKRDEK